MPKRKITSHNRLKKRSSKRQRLNFSRGSIAFGLILIVIIVGSILLVGGISRTNTRETLVGDSPAVLDDQGPFDDKTGLALQTLKFKECTSTITVDLLLDRSTSMANETSSGESKINRLKQAVNELVSNLNDTSVIGIQSFSSDSFTNDVPISYFKDVKNTITTVIDGLEANGSTETYDALAVSRDHLREAVPQFPGRQFNFILISDGRPTQPQPSPNPADEIKGLGVTIYTLGIYDEGNIDQEQVNILKSIASAPENYFQADTADDTARLLTAITGRICESSN